MDVIPMQSPLPEPVQIKRKFPKSLFAIIGILVVILFSTTVYYLRLRNVKQSSEANLQVAVPTLPPPKSVFTSVVSAKQTNSLDSTKLPLGDQKISTTPKVGYIYSCQTTFNGSGAQTNGNWIHGTTWDATTKISVQGNVSWPNAVFRVTDGTSTRVIAGNGLPVKEATGTFPIQSSDPAYQIDRNPNSIKTQTISLSLPVSPSVAESPTCLGGGVIGIALDGVPIFDGLDAGGNDAMAHEVQDACGGHPQQEGMYHYHGPNGCMTGITENNTLVGYALDGYGIYSMYDTNGKEITDADLDSCHGTTSEIMWNGKKVNMYHYVMTREYPYSLGCFKGTPVQAPGQHHGGQQSPGVMNTQQFSPSGIPSGSSGQNISGQYEQNQNNQQYGQPPPPGHRLPPPQNGHRPPIGY